MRRVSLLFGYLLVLAGCAGKQSSADFDEAVNIWFSQGIVGRQTHGEMYSSKSNKMRLFYYTEAFDLENYILKEGTSENLYSSLLCKASLYGQAVSFAGMGYDGINLEGFAVTTGTNWVAVKYGEGGLYGGKLMYIKAKVYVNGSPEPGKFHDIEAVNVGIDLPMRDCDGEWSPFFIDKMRNMDIEFLRQIGYQAIPMGNDTSLSVPSAIDAGLGEQGRHGLLVNPVLGSALRPIKILTDLPIAPDKRIEFGVQAFCKTCKKCARECPVGAIPMDDDYNEPLVPSNNPGVKKWYVDVWKCYKFWQDAGTGCGICLRACPFSKPKSWLHDVVKGISATTPVFNSFFIALDDMMGYGTWSNPDEAVRFWKTAEWDLKG